MTRIPVHTVDSAPEGSRDTLKALGARFGKVLNIHGAMAHSPAVLETYAAIQEALQDTGTFDGKTREAIALVIPTSMSARTAKPPTPPAARQPG